MADTSLTNEPFPTSLCLGVTAEGEEVRLSDDDNLKHLVVLGRSGCGKTSFLLGLLYQQIQRGGGYIFIDGKVSRKTIDQDRKSTRLNSSHLVISYAVFCLKKKKK